MGGKGKKRRDTFGTDWGTAFDSPEFGGSGTSVRKGGTPGGSSRSGGRGRSQKVGPLDHTWCADCKGTGDCVHCDGGYYPRRDGSKAPCGKCRGGLKCHACHGKRIDGKKCGTPTYEEAAERVRQARKSGAVSNAIKGVITAAGMAGAVHGAAAEPHQRSTTTQNKYGESSLRAEGRRRGAQASDATRDKGYRNRGSGQQ